MYASVPFEEGSEDVSEGSENESRLETLDDARKVLYNPKYRNNPFVNVHSYLIPQICL